MNQLKQKILATFLGLLLLVALGEITLALFAHFGLGKDAPSSTAAGTKSFRILFLGNSHTVGAGVGFENSYPAVLRNFFDKNVPGQVNIFNGGMASANTSVIYENLDSLIETAKPDLVVIMAGEPNIWNRRGYADFAAAKNGKNTSNISQELISFLNRSRIFRWASTLSKLTDRVTLTPEQTLEYKAYSALGRLLANSLPQQLNKKQASEIDTVLSEYITRVRSTPPPDSWRSLLNALARFKYSIGDIKGALQLTQESLYYDTEKFDMRAYFLLEEIKKNESLSSDEKNQFSMLWTQARKLFPGEQRFQYLKYVFHYGSTSRPPPQELKSVYEEGLRYAPEGAREVSALAKIYLGDREPAKAANILLGLIASNPLFMDGDIFSTFNIIRDGIKDDQIRENMAQALQRFAQRFPLEKERFDSVDDESLKKWIVSDLEKIVDKLQKNNIAVLVQNYHWIRDRKEANALYEASQLAAERKQIPFLDTHSEFLKYAEKDPKEISSYFTDAFGPNDSHPSAKGHKVIAKIIYEGLIGHKLLPLPLTKFSSEEIYPSAR